MITKILGPEVAEILNAAQNGGTRTIEIAGRKKEIVYPFPSPEDWRDCSIYFIMIDRFNNPDKPPEGRWNGIYDFRQGGTLKGVLQQLPYIADLGTKAVWLSPVLKNSKPEEWRWNYHGYGIQDFLKVDERLGSEADLEQLVTTAHSLGLYVILDIVLNHSARVFDYVINAETKAILADPSIMDGPLGDEPPIEWLNGLGFPRPEWTNTIPEYDNLSPDDAVYPDELRNYFFFRRRGCKLTDTLGNQGFIRGDFDSMRQLVLEYDARVPGQEEIRQELGSYPVLNILIRAYSYAIARFDFDGFRLDTVKYVHPDMIRTFGNAIREFALNIGKKNFFTFGEVYDDEQNIAKFVGRSPGVGEGFGMDAALDFPLFFTLPAVAKGFTGVEAIRDMFHNRKVQEEGIVSSHGEAGSYFVTFLDNHDQKERVKHPLTPEDQVTLALAVMFGLQGIPCVYYGTEQGLDGTKAENGDAALGTSESVREALWGKPNAFDMNSRVYKSVQAIAACRNEIRPLRYGRLYFREISGNGKDFGHSAGIGGVIAFSRILYESEVVVIANTNSAQPFAGSVIVDMDVNRKKNYFTIMFSNKGTKGKAYASIDTFNFWEGNSFKGTGKAAALRVNLDASEVQILGTP